MTERTQMPERFRHDLLDSLLRVATTAEPRLPVAPVRRRIPMRVPLSVAALTAAIVATVLLLSSGGGVAPQSASAASVLRASAAALSRGGTSLALGRGEYLNTRTIVWWRYFDQPRPYVVVSVDERWMARDGSGREVDRVLSVDRRPPARHGPPHAKSWGGSLPPSASPFALAPGVSVSYIELRRLPADPTKLSQAVTRLADRGARRYVDLGLAPAATWRAIFTFDILRALAAAPAPVSVRAAVYQVLARTPGIRVSGPATDAAGRRGTLLTATLGAFRFTLLLDHSTGQLLETSRVLLRRSTQAPGWRPGLINRATYLAAGVVGSTHARVR